MLRIASGGPFLVAAILVLTGGTAARGDVLCIKTTGRTRMIRIRAGTACKPSETGIGSFDGVNLVLSGLNLQIVSGSGSTHGPVNGRGNLIVGYDEDNPPGDPPLDRSGSHNLVIGSYHIYSSSGGLVAGDSNQISGRSASITGGQLGYASGELSSISGGENNQATGLESWVAGGFNNTASGLASAAAGGQLNVSAGNSTSIAGGIDNTATGFATSVSGGRCNIAGPGPGHSCLGISAPNGFATVSGGVFNQALGQNSTVGGGSGRTASGDEDWVAGTLFQDF
jgi:hypothetical protein